MAFNLCGLPDPQSELMIESNATIEVKNRLICRGIPNRWQPKFA